MMIADWCGYLDFRDQFSEAMDPDFYTPEYLDSLILSGCAVFRRGREAAIVFNIKEFPGGVRAVHGVCAAGDLEEIVGELIPAAEQWGRERGCTHALIESRPGWAKALKPGGYDTHQVSVIKEL